MDCETDQRETRITNNLLPATSSSFSAAKRTKRLKRHLQKPETIHRSSSFGHHSKCFMDSTAKKQALEVKDIDREPAETVDSTSWWRTRWDSDSDK